MPDPTYQDAAGRLWVNPHALRRTRSRPMSAAETRDWSRVLRLPAADRQRYAAEWARLRDELGAEEVSEERRVEIDKRYDEAVRPVAGVVG